MYASFIVIATLASGFAGYVMIKYVHLCVNSLADKLKEKYSNIDN